MLMADDMMLMLHQQLMMPMVADDMEIHMDIISIQFYIYIFLCRRSKLLKKKFSTSHINIGLYQLLTLSSLLFW